ncbi:MAG: hypothetical protein KAW09_09970 [Thermoplasmata archaeon]|nr:hypothetical protein [Thermoplasmata archaeon]
MFILYVFLEENTTKELVLSALLFSLLAGDAVAATRKSDELVAKIVSVVLVGSTLILGGAWIWTYHIDPLASPFPILISVGLVLLGVVGYYVSKHIGKTKSEELRAALPFVRPVVGSLSSGTLTKAVISVIGMSDEQGVVIAAIVTVIVLIFWLVIFVVEPEREPKDTEMRFRREDYYRKRSEVSDMFRVGEGIDDESTDLKASIQLIGSLASEREAAHEYVRVLEQHIEFLKEERKKEE